MGKGPGPRLALAAPSPCWIFLEVSLAPGAPPSPQHLLPAVYSDLVNWGDWSLMSSRKIRTS